MRLNTRMRYGTRALVELVRRADRGAVSLAEIAAAQGLSPKYLETLFAALRAAGVVRSQRGVHGGYVLARAPEDVRLSELFGVLEGPEPYVPCFGAPEACPRQDQCATQPVWERMYAACIQVLESTTLADLAGGVGSPPADAAMYHI